MLRPLKFISRHLSNYCTVLAPQRPAPELDMSSVSFSNTPCQQVSYNLQENSLKYGFVITILELPNTIPSLWNATQTFVRENPKFIPEKNLMPFVTAPDGTYNLCHFWSNFEIGDLNFFRSQAYQKYFDHLDRYSVEKCLIVMRIIAEIKIKAYKCMQGPTLSSAVKVTDLPFPAKEIAVAAFERVLLQVLVRNLTSGGPFACRKGGFYLERWGDAPVHSLAVAMLLNSSEVCITVT